MFYKGGKQVIKLVLICWVVNIRYASICKVEAFTFKPNWKHLYEEKSNLSRGIYLLALYNSQSVGVVRVYAVVASYPWW